MRVLVRFLSRVDDGATEARDKTFETSALSLGRGTDQTLHLRDARTALQHAVITRRENGFYIRALALTGVIVNGRLRREAQLQAGDRVQVGENVITVIEPPGTHDFAITFELDPEVRAAAPAAHSYRTRLSQTRLRPRTWAWLGLVLILLLAVAVPALVAVDPAIAQLLRNTPLPDDSWWQSGPLHEAHRFIGDDCSACHRPLRRVRDSQCQQCHDDVQRHYPADLAGYDDPLQDQRCAQCHQEHNQPAMLVHRDNQTCSHCHRNLSEQLDTGLRDVGDFERSHPAVRVSMLVGDEVRRVLLTGAREDSGLRFSHQSHLDPDGIKGDSGMVRLACEDCHLPVGGGAVMRTVDMVRDCQGCHRLDFESRDPERQARHGTAADILADLQQYYAWRYLNGIEDTAELGIDTAVFRRPGRITDRGARERLNAAAADRAAAALDELLVRTCEHCHRRTGNDIAAVTLTRPWLPLAQFDHVEHRALQCSQCHDAANSDEAGDILVPDIDSCRDCHAGQSTAGKSITTCADCHGFHSEPAGAWQ